MGNLYIGNIVRFVDTPYFIKLVKIKEDVLLYKCDNGYIDITEHNDEYVEEYISNILINESDKIISNLPIYSRFIDESSLKLYIKKVKKLDRSILCQ